MIRFAPCEKDCFENCSRSVCQNRFPVYLFPQNGKKVYRILSDAKCIGYESYYGDEDASCAYLSLYLKEISEAAYEAMRLLTERLIRKYHPGKIVLRCPQERVAQFLKGLGFDPEDEHYAKVIEPWRCQVEDRVFDDEGFIINQGLLKDLPFGWFMTDAKGCGWISAYNLLKINHMEKSMEECARGLEKRALFGNAMGQEVLTEWFWLKKQGLDCRISRPSNRKAAEIMKESSSGIVLYNHKRGAHYAAYRNLRNGTVKFYNAFYGRKNHRQKPEEFLKENTLFPTTIVIYVK
ncbi:MAG: hypothetical protein K6G61_05955 [Solobacterium sp.]|nr:hypothetical protein [Solobacterium sp.]